MLGPELLDRITARRAELDELEEQLAKQLAEVRAERDELDHLSAYPGEAFTATGISCVVEKSSGAIANALDKLVKENIAEQVSDQPRTYRLATAQADT